MELEASGIRGIYSIPYSVCIYLNIFLHLRLGLPGGIFLSGCLTETLYSIIMLATWPASLCSTIHDFMSYCKVEENCDVI
jgi:hypothetical protein